MIRWRVLLRPLCWARGHKIVKGDKTCGRCSVSIADALRQDINRQCGLTGSPYRIILSTEECKGLDDGK